MSRIGTLWRSLSGIAIGGAYVFSANCTLAQITPDRSLTNNSIVTPNGSVFNINGGTQAGRNLFHSFQQFSVFQGETASFNNGLDIQNIISRVTGGSASTIDGLIKVNGTANLFFINPSGIVFGKNASLDIRGSFVASTASAIKFADGSEFNANASQTSPLLTISVPLGLQLGKTAGGITVQESSLKVNPGKTLALVGGDVGLNGGSLQSPNGRVELAAIGPGGTVGLNFTNDNLSLSVPDTTQRGDVSLTNKSLIDVTDRGQGSVAITGRNIDILGQSKISAGIKQGMVASGSQPGDIDLNATGSVTINQTSRVSNQVEPFTTGNAGNINIKAGEILITNQANHPPDKSLSAALITEPESIDGNDNSTGKGRAGDISLESTGSISLIGQSINPEDKLISTFARYGSLGSGNISLKAKGSIFLNNAYVVSSDFSGNSIGNILLQGDKSISIVNNSSVVSTNFSVGNSGNITLLSNGSISLRTSMISARIGSTDLNSAILNLKKIRENSVI
jgi:filamentous hemagglutinin family protein